MDPIQPDLLLTHLRYLTETIGVRLAGQPGEQAAGEYLAAQFAAAGARVQSEVFPVATREVTTQELQVFFGGAWHVFPCSLFVNTPGTGGEWVEGPLVFFDSQTGYQETDLAAKFRGKIVLHLGTHLESPDHYRRLVAAAPLAVLMVDVRYPGASPLADAIFPAYARLHGAVTVLNVAYLDAWRWREQGATQARCRVVGGMRPAESSNIIAEFPGTDPEAGVIYVGAHHDTQADSVGADDNGSGAAGLIELARVLAPLPRLRTIRLISFGAEEQLSVGSAAYVRRHRADLANAGRCMVNLDSFGSLLGWNVLTGVLPPAIASKLAPHFQRHGQFFRHEQIAQPYFDHFPFLAAGVPGVSLIRNNCASGRFFHHRPDDTIARLSPEVMASLLQAVGDLVNDLANTADLGAEALISEVDRPTILESWNNLFGGWEQGATPPAQGGPA
ncbi:MAG: ywaD 1 [Verrucomicrobia bacterium]|nr:ywaD 1 [Verrucomicrobiota bacterium]